MYDPELDRFKTEINLAEYAAKEYGFLMDTRSSSRNSLVMRTKENGEKIVVVKGTDNHFIYFAPVSPYFKDQGSIIDFVQVRTRKNLGEIRKVLRQYSGIGRHAPFFPEKIEAIIQQLKPSTKDRQKIIQDYENFNALKYSQYLESRAVGKEIYLSNRFSEKIKVDQKGNLIFPHFDKKGICGYELKNQNFKGFSEGSEKGIWSSNRFKNDERLVITESVINALSYHVLHGTEKTRYAATSGGWSEKTKEMIKVSIEALPKKNGTVILAFDNDKEGKKYDQDTRELIENLKINIISNISKGNDWNEDLLEQVRSEKF